MTVGTYRVEQEHTGVSQSLVNRQHVRLQRDHSLGNGEIGTPVIPDEVLGVDVKRGIAGWRRAEIRPNRSLLLNLIERLAEAIASYERQIEPVNLDQLVRWDGNETAEAVTKHPESMGKIAVDVTGDQPDGKCAVGLAAC